MIKFMIHLAKIIVISFIALLFGSCNFNMNFGDGIKGNGKVTSEVRNISENFESIKVSHGIEVILTQSNNKLISVETDENIQNHIIIKVENGVLIVKADENYNTSKSPKVTINTPVINDLKASSASEISSTNVLKSNNMEIDASSGSEINIDIEAENISLESSSGSEITANGKAIKLQTNASSGSNINAQELMANEIIATASSGSDTDVFPILSLKAKASSGADISYHKSPKSIAIAESSGGSVSEN